MEVNTYRKDEEKITEDKKNLLLRVLKYYGRYRGQIVLVILMVVFCSAVIAVIPRLAQHAVDVNVAQHDAGGLVFTMGLSVCLSLLTWLFYVLREHILSSITNEIVYDIRKEVFDHLQSLSLYYFDSRPTGKILSRLVGDVSSLKEMLTKLISTLIPNVILLVGIITVMVVSNVRLALAVFVVVPFLVVSVYFVTVRGFRNWENYRQKTSNMNAYVHESFSGIRVIQAFNAEKESTEENNRVTREVEKAWVKAVGRADLLNIVVSWSQGLGYFVLFLAAVKWLNMGESSVGQLVAFSAYIVLFWQPIRALASMYNQLTNELTGAGRVFELLDTPPTLRQLPGAADLKVERGEVEFRNIGFAYPDEPETEILHNVSFTAKPGEMIALVGPTGAGKTTIVNLLVRFYDPVSGIVLIDGQDIAAVTLESLRKNIGVMTQEPFLFSGTLRENLSYGKPDATDREILNACERTGLSDFIRFLPDGLDSEVSSDMMSQGQKQLIALARTLIADPAIIILDEATSAIDTATERKVQAGMAVLMKGRTSFVVAHRLSTIIMADRIMVIQDKGIAEQGTHAALLERNGLYAALYRAQFDV